ncbi:hypothetical protein WAF17_02725 [Bernardetia sp. ABR2-2B]|uniref:hypothetical protein n=1 Tax=Bernardetia sp. ABR2-2B TaxID=3127472 RepID=UPI0030D3A356
MIEPQKRHFNKPQLLSHLIFAQIMILIWGRGTGKSTGVIAPWSLRNVIAMPRSNGIFVGKTYEQLLIRTLPPVIAGLEKLGIYENIHYFIGKFAPKSWKWDKAYTKPIKADHYIHFWNGAGIYLVSQDRVGSSNSLSVDFVAGDEAKLLNKERLDEEVLLTLRGNAQYFGHLSNHYSQLFTTDRPKGAAAKWLLNSVNEMDAEVIETILQLSAIVEQQKIEQYHKPNKTRAYRIKMMEEQLHALRKGTTLVSFASTLDNIHALGFDAISNMKRNLTPTDFTLSVLNKDTPTVEVAFYPTFDIERLGYNKPNYSFIESLEYEELRNKERDCRHDGDLWNAPLDIAFDNNNKINSLVVGQAHGRYYDIINAMFVLGENKEFLKHLCKKFDAYYKYHKIKCNKIHFHYDHTAKKGDDRGNKTSAESTVEELQKLGWEVEEHDAGHAPDHTVRYPFFITAFNNEDSRLPIFRFNEDNCKPLTTSIEDAGSYLTLKGETKKDKKTEQSTLIPPEESTHFSEAFDMLIYPQFAHLIQEQAWRDVPVP